MDIHCPACGGEVSDAGNMYLCDNGEQCRGGFKVWARVAGYTLSEEDLTAICAGQTSEEHEFISKAGKPFRAKLRWDFEEQRVIFKFREAPKVIEGVMCPDHEVELRASDKRYYCPTKLEDETWCRVGVWRSYGDHEVTPEQLSEILSGVPVGPWELTKRDGTGTYEVMATFDFEENKVVTIFVEPAGKGYGRKGGLGV